MLIQGQISCHLEMAREMKRCRIILGTIHHALLKRGVEFPPGQGSGRSTQSPDEGHRRWALLGSDLEPLQILRPPDGCITGIETPASGIVEGKSEKPFRSGFLEQLPTDFSLQHCTLMRRISEEIGQSENPKARCEIFHHRG